MIDGLETFVFPGGEVHSKLVGQLSSIVVCRDYSMNGFMELCQYVDIIRRDAPSIHLALIYPYLPYARQDRVFNETEPFSLKIFCDLVNTLKFDRVTIYDPHSDVAPALINNCEVHPQHLLAEKALSQTGLLDSAMFVAPDAGAYKKLTKLIADDSRIAVGTKVRDADGKVVSSRVFSPTPLEGRDCVVVDDICDGGATFIGLAKELKKKGAKDLYLYVTHGIFSKGLDELKQYYKQIFTTDSICKLPASEFLNIMELDL